MAKQKRKLIENLLFEVYDKGLQQNDCNLTDYYEKIQQVLNITDVMFSLPSQAEIDEQIDRYAFRVPYDGSNNFYDEVALKHYKAGIEWLLGRIRGNDR